MNIRKEIMEEWKDSFIASDEEQAYDAYPYNIKPFIHEEVTKFLSQALTRIEEAAYKKGWENAQKQSLSCLCDCHTYSVDKRHCINCDFKLSPQEEKISFEDGLEIVKKIQEKKDCVCEQCPECGKFIELPFRQYHIEHECLGKSSHPSPEELEEKVTDLSFRLTDMLMRMYTSKKHKETFYVSKISEELQKIIDKELSAQKERISKAIEGIRHEDRHYKFDSQGKKLVRLDDVLKLLEGDSK